MVGVSLPKVNSTSKGTNARSTHGNMKDKKEETIEFIAIEITSSIYADQTHVSKRCILYFLLCLIF
jgi:hypothetical protein